MPRRTSDVTWKTEFWIGENFDFFCTQIFRDTDGGGFFPLPIIYDYGKIYDL